MDRNDYNIISCPETASFRLVSPHITYTCFYTCEFPTEDKQSRDSACRRGLEKKKKKN